MQQFKAVFSLTMGDVLEVLTISYPRKSVRKSVTQVERTVIIIYCTCVLNEKQLVYLFEFIFGIQSNICVKSTIHLYFYQDLLPSALPTYNQQLSPFYFNTEDNGNKYVTNRT